MPADLLSLLPPEAEERLREMAHGYLTDPWASDEEKVEAFADLVLDKPGIAVDGHPVRIAFLLVLLIEQAREVAALEAELREIARDPCDLTATDRWCRTHRTLPPCPVGRAAARLLATPEPAADG